MTNKKSRRFKLRNIKCSLLIKIRTSLQIFIYLFSYDKATWYCFNKEKTNQEYRAVTNYLQFLKSKFFHHGEIDGMLCSFMKKLLGSTLVFT